MGNLFTSSKPVKEKGEQEKPEEQQQQKKQPIKEEELPTIEVELLICGDPGVGKSVWRQKFVDDSVGFGDAKYGEKDKEIPVMVQEYRCKGRDLNLNLVCVSFCCFGVNWSDC